MIQPLSSSKTERKRKIIKGIRDRVDYSREAESKPYTFYKDFCFWDCQLPVLADMQPQLRQLYITSVVDDDMKCDLEDTQSINWFPQAVDLLPVCAPKDGNCLLHAASLAVWGVEDTQNTLRDLMLMSVQNNNNFKKRWWGQLLRNLQSLEINQSEVIDREWDDVIRSISDLGSTSLSVAVPHRFLESVHIYILANILRRPIIIVTNGPAKSLAGHELQENHIGGLYLPLEWAPIECCKTPIILGYSFSHFCPLLSQSHLQGRTTLPGKAPPLLFPLVNRDLSFLLVRYLMKEEEPKAWDLLQSYLLLKEVDVMEDGGTVTKAPFAQLYLKPLEPERNSLFEHLELLKERLKESEFLKASRGQLYNTLQPAQQSNHPFYDIEMKNQTQVVPVKTVTGTAEIHQDPHQSRITHTEYTHEGNLANRSQCIVDGCTNQGKIYLDNFCYDCFKILLAAQPSAVTGSGTHHLTTNPTAVEGKQFQKLTSETALNVIEGQAVIPTAPLLSLEPQSQNVQPLSMMTERCKNQCGYRCSYQTYPYCYECYPAELLRREKLDQSNTIASAPLKNDESVESKSENKDSSFGVIEINDPYALDISHELAKPLPSQPVTFAGSNSGSPHYSSSQNSWLLENEDEVHLYHLLNDTPEIFPKSQLEITSDPNDKNVEYHRGAVILDDICFSGTEDQKSVEGNSQHSNVEPHLQRTPGKPVSLQGRAIDILPVQTSSTNDEVVLKGFAESFAEIDRININVDIEVSEEPPCKVKCASRYCDTMIISPDKLCNKCNDILKRGFEQNLAHAQKSGHITASRAIQDQTEKEKKIHEQLETFSSVKKIESKLEKDEKNPDTFLTIMSQESRPSEKATESLDRKQQQYRTYASIGKPCIVLLCPNYGDPQMDNKCSLCYFKSNPSAKPRRTLETGKRREETSRQTVTEQLPYTSVSQQGESSRQSQYLHSAHLTRNTSPVHTEHSSGARAAEVEFHRKSSHVDDPPPPVYPHQALPTIWPESSIFSQPSSNFSLSGRTSILVTSKTSHNPYESVPFLPPDSSYSFKKKADKNFERTLEGIEKTWKNSVKTCLTAKCQNFGNKDKEGYCNACFKVIRRQRIIERQAKYGEDVPDSNAVDCA